MCIFVKFKNTYRQSLLAKQLNIPPLCIAYSKTTLFLVEFVFVAPLPLQLEESQVFYSIT